MTQAHSPQAFVGATRRIRTDELLLTNGVLWLAAISRSASKSYADLSFTPSTSATSNR